MTINPNVYVLGGSPELRLEFLDLNDLPMVPVEYRLSIKSPLGLITTVSGTDIGWDITASGFLAYVYHPETIGWYEYEGWGRDGMGREIAQTNGFEVIDRVY